MLKIFLIFLFTINVKSQLSFKEYKIFRIKKIEGQLSEKVKEKLESKYWKGSTKKDKQIKIEYEIFEFLDFLYVKCKISIGKKEKAFSIKYVYSKEIDWNHDEELVNEIAKTIHEQANFLKNQTDSKNK